MDRILVIRIDFLGDMVCTTAFLHALKKKWPSAELHVLANKYNRGALLGNPDVDKVHTYVYSKQCERNERPGRLRALVDRVALVMRLRRLRFDLLVIPNGGMNKNSIQFARQLGVADSRWHDESTEFDDRKPAHVRDRPLRHEALSGFALVPELGQVDVQALRLHVSPDPQLQAAWQQTLGVSTKARVGLFTSNNAQARRWGAEKWQDLATRLADRAEVVIFRDPAQRATAAESRSVVGREIRPSTVADLIAATSLLDAVVSADSAPVHIASALGKPVVAMFEDRPEKYRRWHPLGVPHVLLHAGPRVDDIGVEAVEQAAMELINRAVAQRAVSG